jgi:hypothetical protein
MDKYVPKPGYGSAFKNDKKTEDWHGDFKGKVMLPDGNEHYVDIYNANTKDGQPYFKMKIGKPVANQPGQYSAAHQPFPAKQKPAASGFDDVDSDVPF